MPSSSEHSDPRNERLAELRRAAYSRDASDDDRAALAAFEREHPAEIALSPAPARRRSAWPVALGALVLGAALGAATVVVGTGLLRGDAFDRFAAAAPADRAAIAEVSALLAMSTREPGTVWTGGAIGSTVIAGPVPLHSSHGVDLYALLALAPDEDEQQVCLIEVEGGSYASVCVPRSQFEEQGISHRFARDDELNAVLEIVWRADDSVTIREADLSRIP